MFSRLKLNITRNISLSGATINIMESGQKRRERSPEPGPLVAEPTFLIPPIHVLIHHRIERGSSRYQAAPKRSEMILIIKKRKNNLDHPGGAGKIFDQHGNGPGQSRGGLRIDLIISSIIKDFGAVRNEHTLMDIPHCSTMTT